MSVFRVEKQKESDIIYFNIGETKPEEPFKYIRDVINKVVSNFDEVSPFLITDLDLFDDFDETKYSTDIDFFNDYEFDSSIRQRKDNNPLLAKIECIRRLKTDNIIEDLPIVFFSDLDYLDKSVQENLKFGYFPQALNFLESSIWFHYIPQFTSRDKNLFVDRLKSSIKAINRYSKQNLYNTKVSAESRDLHIRFFQNSYLEGKGHDQHVTPFIFHSRTEIIKKRKEIFYRDGAKTLFEKYHQDLKWRVLLVDDFADVHLKTNDESKGKTKKEIIENVLSDTFTVEVAEKSQKDKKSIPLDLSGVKSEVKVCIIKKISEWLKGKISTQKKEKKEDSLSTNEEVNTNECNRSEFRNKSNIIFESASYDNINIVWKTLKKLSTETYDVILLDYLLGARSGQYASRREYSHRLLKVINCICEDEIGFTESNIEELRKYAPKDENENDDNIKNIISGIKKHKGPLGHFWIFNISTFQTAFQDRMREQSLSHNSEHWILSRGADPVSTPELFKCTLYQFMNLQLKKAVQVNDIIEFIDTKEKIMDGEKIPKANDWAISIFGEFIHNFYGSDVLRLDSNNGSKFAESILKLSKYDLDKKYNLIEHFRHLLYTLAFDSGLKMQVAWEELQLIKRKLTIEQKEQLSSVIKKLEKYISETLNKFN